MSQDQKWTLTQGGSVLTFETVEDPNQARILLTIHKDGRVTAPDLESASAAGRAFVESVRDQLAVMFGVSK